MHRTTETIFIIIAALFAFCFFKKEGPVQQEGSCIICDRLSLFTDIKQRVAASYWSSFNTKSLTPPLVYFSDSLSWLAFSADTKFKDIEYIKIECPSGLVLYKMNKRLDSVPFHMENKMSFTDSAMPYFKHPVMFCSDVESTAKLVPDVKNTEEWLQLVMHEYFHSFQFNHTSFINYFADSVHMQTDSLNNYYKNNDWFSELAGIENDCLLKAISASSRDSLKYFCKQFIETRKERRQRFIKQFQFDISPAEKFWEKTEGTARYMEYNTGFIYENGQITTTGAKCDTLFNHFNNYYKKDFEKQPWFYIKTQIMRAYYYVTGFNLCRVLDKLKISYKEDLFDRPSAGLEDFLTGN